jgi:hypothetical protein
MIDKPGGRAPDQSIVQRRTAPEPKHQEIETVRAHELSNGGHGIVQLEMCFEADPFLPRELFGALGDRYKATFRSCLATSTSAIVLGR